MKISKNLENAAIREFNSPESMFDWVTYVAEAPDYPLFHFTNLDNLTSISEHGILDISNLLEKKIPFVPTDKRVLDSNQKGISLSVGLPNSKMMISKRNKGEIDQESLVVFEISSLVLKNPFLAFPTNSARFSHAPDEVIMQFIGWSGFFSMFKNGYLQSNPEIRVERESLQIHSYMPTDPQAEILSLYPINSSLITHIHISTRQLKQLDISLHRLMDLYPSANASVYRTASYERWNRFDWQYWFNSSIDPYSLDS